MSETFPFVQLEFSHHLGPPQGRYVVRPFVERAPQADEEILSAPLFGTAAQAAEEERLASLLGQADVLVLRVEGAAPARARLFGRRADGDRREVSLTVATVIKATERLDGPAGGARLIGELRRSDEELVRRVEEGVAIVDRAVAAYRACAADPYVAPLSRLDARAVRVGYGSADELKVGNWADAIDVPLPRQPRMSRAARLMPTQGMAAVLAGRARVLESEELLLRVLLDLEHGRLRAAAAGLRAAHQLLAVEMESEVLDGMIRTRFENVLRAQGDVAQLAERALERPLSPAEAARLAELAEDAGALIDSWRYRPESAA